DRPQDHVADREPSGEQLLDRRAADLLERGLLRPELDGRKAAGPVSLQAAGDRRLPVISRPSTELGPARPAPRRDGARRPAQGFPLREVRPGEPVPPPGDARAIGPNSSVLPPAWIASTKTVCTFLCFAST